MCLWILRYQWSVGLFLFRSFLLFILTHYIFFLWCYNRLLLGLLSVLRYHRIINFLEWTTNFFILAYVYLFLIYFILLIDFNIWLNYFLYLFLNNMIFISVLNLRLADINFRLTDINFNQLILNINIIVDISTLFTFYLRNFYCTSLFIIILSHNAINEFPLIILSTLFEAIFTFFTKLIHYFYIYTLNTGTFHVNNNFKIIIRWITMNLNRIPLLFPYL